MAERLRVADSLAQMAQSDWEHLATGRPALRLEVLTALERSATRPMQLQAFLLEGGTGLAAAAVCEPVTGSRLRSALDTLLFGRALSVARAFGVLTAPVLIFRPPLGDGAAVVSRDTSPVEGRRLLTSLFDGIERHAAERKLGIACVGIPGDDTLVVEVLRERRYLETEARPTARLEVEWNDFEGYVAYLRQRSKNAAQTARTERNRNRKSGVRIRLLPGGTADAALMYRLARAHYHHKNGRDPLYGPEFLPRLVGALGDDFLAFEAQRGGRRVAMLGVVRSGDVGWLSWLGLELPTRPNDFMYSNLCFYALAESAAGLGLRTLLYGSGALGAKLIRGCRVTVNHLFYRPHRPLARRLAGPYFSLHRAWYRRKLR